ncbi:transcription factor/nuclear export subunit protein 2-domain-containing protein [Schizothecium vesticola]|uniref:THO complex subunit 2 n=1 Tax=Schizothecium vesticola TaxID=314040 RepID=A0AA40ER53_9PEZI|nr:transcription factor/nuclear export subunit protein 2-domain-containing protein [Schizothecium vesticola]
MPPKRKRPTDTGPPRPSPHRPGDTSLGRHDGGGYEGGRGRNGGGGGGGGGGRNPRRGDRRDSSQSFHSAPPASSAAASGPISPTLTARPPSLASTATLAKSVQASAPPAPPSPPLSPIQPGYFYSVITDERVEKWTQGGRQEVVDHGVQSRDDEDLIEVTTIFQELLHSAADGRLSGTDAGEAVKDILGPEAAEADRATLAFDPHMLFLDTVATFFDVEPGPVRRPVAELMTASGVSPGTMRLVLDPPILQQLDLIRDTFTRMAIRQSTNLLYRIANYNLLREETEGFSKVITELYITSSVDRPSTDVVQAAFHRVMSLIGTFDLHPGRVLDATLDVFASVLIKHCRFFLKFLRVSSWWPRSQLKVQPSNYTGGLPAWAQPGHFDCFTSKEEETAAAAQRLQRDISFWERARDIKMDAFFELGGRQVADADAQRLLNSAAGDGQETDVEREWIRLTKTLPPSGNKDAAQMVGFKLQFYYSEARDEKDILPANLLYLIALLIKVGFISLTDLWQHIWPADDDMESQRVKRLKELEEEDKKKRQGSNENALMSAGVLPDDMPAMGSSRRDVTKGKAEPGSKPEAADKPSGLPDALDQKVGILKNLLTIGALPEALFIIGRHGWIVQAYPDVQKLLFRIIHHSLDLVYQQCRPVMPDGSEMPQKRTHDPDQSGMPKGGIRLINPPPRRALRWPFEDGTAEGINYRFYWDEWADNVPVCQNVDDVFTLCDTLVNVVGVNIGRDAPLVAKITGIGAKSLAEDQSPENKSRWLGLLKRLLVPSLSLSDENSSLVEHVWGLLRLYPIHIRYNIYAEWYEGSVSRLPPMQKAFAATRLQTLAIMKRLSRTNIPEMARALAISAYPSPGILCKVALHQIESYSNLIDAFVECAGYFTDLGYDVLVWSVLSSIGGQRSRTQADSVLLTSKWLQALSKFSGKVFRHYSNMDPVPILRYVNDQLLKGNSTDLLILRELIEHMGGVVSGLDFTEAQLRAMTGGDRLRQETLVGLGDMRFAAGKGSVRLMKALVNTKLAGPLLINIAQYRQNAIYKVMGGDAHIKYLSTVVDDTHQILLQYLDLLRHNTDGDTFSSLVPGIVQLIRDFGLETGLAFMIGRASLRLAMNTNRLVKDRPVTDVDGDVLMDPAAEAADSKEDVDANPSKPASGPLLDALQPLIDEIPAVLPEHALQHLSPLCYVLFWSLQLGDFAFPQESYTAENHKLGKQAEEVMRDRSDMTRAGMNKKTQKRKDILDRQDMLIKENNVELTRFSKTRFQIAKQLVSWFPTDMSKVDATSDAFLEECILPRLQLSPVDAEYCFKLIKYLHEFSAPNFKLMSLYDRLFNHNRLRAILFTCSVREAEQLGRFLRCVLGDLSRWHSDKNAYEKEALGAKDSQGKKTRQYLGFATILDADGKPTLFVEHDAYRDLLFRWHKELNSALRSCLNELEWMHIRNAITVLKSVIDFFPAINFMAEKFLEQLKTITDRETATKHSSDSDQGQGHRVDLSVTAQTTYSELQRRKPKWIMVQAFRPGLSADARDDLKSPTVPSHSSLRASAPEFKLPAGGKKPPAEVEDGEVKDGKGARITNGDTKVDGLPKPPLPTREPPKDQRLASNSTRPATPKPLAAVPVSGSGTRTESGRYTTLPPSSSTLPSKPEPPSRPDVSYQNRPAGVPERFPPRHDRKDAPREPLPREPLPTRELPPRDGRDFRDPRERDPRDTREPHSRENREPLGVRDSRDYRVPDTTRPERPREFPPTARRPAEPNPRDAGRSDREWPGRTEPPPRWSEHGLPERDPRPSRDRPPQGSTREEPRPPRDHVVPPPLPPPAPQREAPGHLVNPDRLRQMETDSVINPVRAALIGETRDPARSSSRDQGRDRASRTDSPRRSDHPAPSAPADNARDDRHGRHRHSDHHNRDAPPNDNTPSRPERPERTSERQPERGARETPSSAPPARAPPSSAPPARAADHDHGRLNQQDPNYGRLNSIPSVVDGTVNPPPGPPSGPRDRGRYTARVSSTSGPPSRPDGRFPTVEPIRPPSPERHPPTGPSFPRRGRGQYDSNSNVNSPTTSGPPTGPGVHPDRMGRIPTQPPPAPAAPSAPAPPPVPTAPVGIHPDRLTQMGAPPLAQPSGPSSMSRPPVNTPDRPPNPNTGPRAPPVNTDFSTPTGPAGSADRMRPGGSRQLRGIQSTLEKASADSGRGPGSYRSRGMRPNLADSDAQILAGLSPVTTPITERPDPVRDSLRQDTGPGRAPRAEPIQVVSDSRDSRDSRRNGDDHSSRGDHDRSSRRDHHRSDRSNRNSRRNSRERSADREREGKEPREHRERRPDAAGSISGPPREAERESGSRRPRESGGGRESLSGSNRDMGPPREPGHRAHRNDVPSGPPRLDVPSGRIEGHGGRDSLGGRGGDEYGGSGRSGSSRGNGPPRESRPRPSDDRDARGDDRGRKRRSEGGVESTSTHQDKRPRR